MSNTYDDAINKLITHIDDAVIFSKEHLPDVANQLLIYGATVHTYWAVGSGILALIFFIVFLSGYLAGDGEAAFLSCAAFLVTFAICMGNVMNIKKIEVAPKVYVIEEVRGFVK